MGTQSHNKRLLELIRQAEQDVAAASDQDDLLGAIAKVRDFPEALTFDNAVAGFSAAAGAGFCALGMWLMIWAPQSVQSWMVHNTGWDYSTMQLVPAVIGVVTTFSALAFMGNRSNMLPEVTRRIARASAYFTLGLRQVRAHPEEILSRLLAEFTDYCRGSFSREIRHSLEGTYQGPLHRIPYAYHHLHYVNQRVVVEQVPDGKGGTRTELKTVYDEYDRYSLVLHFPWVREITVRSDGMGDIDRETGWETSSSDFNSYFALTGESQLACAKFAKPSTVLALLQLPHFLASVNLEFSSEGKLCLSFSNDDLLGHSVTASLVNPNAFYQEIAKGVQVPLLTHLLDWVHKLAEQHDDNFTPRPNPESLQEP